MSRATTSIHQKILKDVTTGEELLSYLYGDNGLQYTRLSNFDSSGVVTADWDAFALRDDSGNTLLTYIELSPIEDTPALSEIKQYFKRHGRDETELFTIIGKRVTEGKFLQTEIKNKITFIRVEDRLAGDDIDLEFDLRIFEFDKTDIEPVYLDYLSDLTIKSDDDFDSLSDRVEKTFSLKTVTNRFYREFGEIFQETLKDAIHGIDTEEIDKGSYAQLVVNRILFLMFVQQKGWLNRNITYVQDRYEDVRNNDQGEIYDDLFSPLFFKALSNNNQHEFDNLGTIPYFNGGLFEQKDYEKGVSIDDEFFDALLNPEEDPNTHEPKGFLRRYKISLSESNPSEQQLVVDPEFIGRIFEMVMQSEEPEERREKGAFYTPKPITQYMAKNSLKQYLFGDYSKYSEEIIELVSNHEISDNLSEQVISDIRQEIKDISIVDPAVGSGAFIIAMIEELVGITEVLNNALDIDENTYDLKENYISTSLYGVDIDPSGIELCKFRVWLHLMQDLHTDVDTFIENDNKYSLPNLELKFFVGNSLVGDYKPTKINETISDVGYQGQLDGNYGESSLPERIAELRQEYTYAHGEKKRSIEEELNELISVLDSKISWEKTDHWMDFAEDNGGFKWSVQIPEVMISDQKDSGFDIVIGNPPYEGRTRAGYKSNLQSLYSKEHGFNYYAQADLFQFFVHRARELTRSNGIYTYIMSDTFFANRNKQDVRKTLLSDIECLTTVNPNAFDASVETAIFLSRKGTNSEWFEFNHYRTENIRKCTSLVKPPKFSEQRSESEQYIQSDQASRFLATRGMYKTCLNRSIFIPSQLNVYLYNTFMREAKDVYEQWDNEINNIRSLRKSRGKIKDYLTEREPGDTVLFGVAAEGGKGIETSNNSEFIAVREGTQKANRIRKNGYYSRSKLEKIISEDEILSVNNLTEEEKREGVDFDAQYWVKITRESKSSRDMYFSPTDEYIDWRVESVEYYRSNGNLRNSQYYFKKGMATKMGGGVRSTVWRIIEPSVFTQSNQVFFPLDSDTLSIYYLVGVMNSTLLEHISDTFLNRIGQTTGDVRRLPIKVPSQKECEEIVELVKEAISIQKTRTDVLEKPDKERIREIDKEIDTTVEEIYGVDDINPEYQ